jgi:hypothetical protein
MSWAGSATGQTARRHARCPVPPTPDGATAAVAFHRLRQAGPEILAKYVSTTTWAAVS